MTKGDVIRILAPGLSASLQDLGMAGGRRFGVPPGGAMDDHAATFVNRLLDNPPESPILELLLQGARLAVLQDTWIALGGADAHCNLPLWRTVHVQAGQEIQCLQSRSGVWSYLAVKGGFDGHHSRPDRPGFSRGAIGQSLRAGDVLSVPVAMDFQLPSRVAGRVVAWDEQWDYAHPSPLRLWPGPQWHQFSEEDRARLLESAWQVTPQSNRVGYRLEGSPLKSVGHQIVSEPVLVGTLQIPQNGQPIVTMRDGPTVGGYPKIGLLDPPDVARLAQCRPGQSVRFQLET